MNQRRTHSRRGLTITEVVVAATLVVSMIGLVAPLTVRIGRVWQSTRQYRLAFNELANQMEFLSSLEVAHCEDSLTRLKPSAYVVQFLPGAKLEGEMIRDQDGTRLVLSLNWDRGSQSIPISLVGWLTTDSVELADSAAENSELKASGRQKTTRLGYRVARPKRLAMGVGSVANDSSDSPRPSYLRACHPVNRQEDFNLPLVQERELP